MTWSSPPVGSCGVSVRHELGQNLTFLWRRKKDSLQNRVRGVKCFRFLINLQFVALVYDVIINYLLFVDKKKLPSFIKTHSCVCGERLPEMGLGNLRCVFSSLIHSLSRNSKADRISPSMPLQSLNVSSNCSKVSQPTNTDNWMIS